MAGSTDRGSAIIGGSYLEECVTRALRQHLGNPGGSSQKWLFESPGPLSTFESKLRLARVTGLFSEEFFRDLVVLKNVRNWFAHRLDFKSFDDPKVEAELGKLKKIVVGIMVIERLERRPATARERYESAVGEACGIIGSRRFPAMPKPSI